MEPKAELTLQFITMHLYISKATNILYYNIILLFKNMTLKCYKNIRFFFFFLLTPGDLCLRDRKQ